MVLWNPSNHSLSQETIPEPEIEPVNARPIEDVVEIPASEPESPSVVSESTPPPPPRKKSGGPDFHRPGCKCRACVSRRRQKEARLRAPGPDEPFQLALVSPKTEVEVIEADIPSDRILRRIRSRPEKTAKGRVAEWVRWRALEPNLSNADIARKIGISPKTMYGYLSRAARQGWLKFDDPMSRLEFEIMPKATDNLSYFLDARDRTVTIEVAKGTLFKQFQESQGISDAPKTILALKLELPSSDGDTPRARGVIMGTPKIIDLDID